MKKISWTNRARKQAGATILVPENICFKLKEIGRDKGGADLTKGKASQ